MKNFYERITMGILLMAITGIGILFIGAVPIVTVFGGFSKNATSIGDGLASIGWTFLIGFIGYVAIFGYLLKMWLF